MENSVCKEAFQRLSVFNDFDNHSFDNLKKYSTADYPGGLKLSCDIASSHIPPKFVTVHNVNELRTLVHPLQADNCIHENIPSYETVKDEVKHPAHPYMCQALSEFAFGSSSSVASWEKILNAKRFPMQIAVFVASEIEIFPNNPLIIGDVGELVALVCKTIKMHNTSMIKTKAGGSVTCDFMNVINDGSNSKPFGSIIQEGKKTENAPDGNDALKANTGIAGTDSKENGKYDYTEPTAGSNGGDGGNGGNGGNAANGSSAGDITFTIGEANDTYQIESMGTSGGNGGNGGKGGDGGDGGAGGKGKGGKGDAPNGNGGAGGTGGTGGNGGNGGNGGVYTFNYISGSPKFIINDGKKPAPGGAGGTGGTGGTGGKGNSSGKAGKPGTAGKPGQFGEFGKVFINQNTNTLK